MKKLIFSQKNPQLGLVKVQMVIEGWKVFLKRNNMQDISAMIKQLRDNNVSVEETPKLVIINWLDKLEEVKLGTETITRDMSYAKLESILAEFYCLQYAKMGFKPQDLTENG